MGVSDPASVQWAVQALYYMSEGYDNHFNAGTPLMREHVERVDKELRELAELAANWHSAALVEKSYCEDTESRLERALAALAAIRDASPGSAHRIAMQALDEGN